MFRSRLVPCFVAASKETVEQFENHIANIDWLVNEAFKNWRDCTNKSPLIKEVEKTLQSGNFDFKWLTDASLAFYTYGKDDVEKHCKIFAYEFFKKNYKEFETKLNAIEKAWLVAEYAA